MDEITIFAPGFFRESKMGYSEDYNHQEQLGEFWQLHQRFGVIRTPDQRIVLVTKTDADGRGLIASMKQAFNSPNSFAPTRIREIPESFAYDVSQIVSPLVAKLHETYMGTGPNCWNLCLRMARIARGLHGTMDGEFKFWLNSPLATRIKDSKDLRVGDIISWRLRDPKNPQKQAEVHAAVYVAPGVVFSKNGPEEHKPYRLMDIDEVFSMFSHSANHVALHRFKSLPDFMKEHQQIIPRELTEAYVTLKEREAFIESALSPESEISRRERSIASRAFRPVADALTQRANANIQALTQNTSLTRTQVEALMTLWQGVIFRISSLRI